MSTKQQVLTKVSTKNEITTEQSQKLIQTLLSMSFGCLAFLRGLFPDDNFIDQRFVPEKVVKNYDKSSTSQANSIKIKTLLRGKSEEVDLFLDWLENGVFQSVRMKYLKALSLGIFTDENDPYDLVENYVFSFEYDNDNGINFKVESDRRGVVTSSLLDSRKAVQQLMRRFIILTQSLEPLPDKKYLTMRLMFNDKTPKDYQPSLFKDATYDKPPTIKLPNQLKLSDNSVGTLNTNHHKMSLSVFSLCDASTMQEDNDMKPDDLDELNQLQEKQYQYIDPLELASNNIDALTNSIIENTQSQMSNILNDILKSSQPNIQPTQISENNQNRRLDCECRLPCPGSSTTTKECKCCDKLVHGVCYGNIHSKKVDECFTCLYGSLFNKYPAECNDLMMARKCYRILSRTRSFPNSIKSFFQLLVPKEDINNSVQESIKFALYILFDNDILNLNDHSETKYGNKARGLGNDVKIDVPGIFTDIHEELETDKIYNFSFTYRSANIHSFYIKQLPDDINEMKYWIDEVTRLKKKYHDTINTSVDIQSLVINDTCTQDPIVVGQKRKNIHISDSEAVEDSMNAETSMNLKLDSYKTPIKIRKISVSKKTLKSAW